jgi:hypothetical protein
MLLYGARRWHEFLNSRIKKKFMEQVYYKGNRYLAKETVIGGNRRYSLYNDDGILLYFVNKDQLDRKTFLDHFVETYLRLAGLA